LPSSDLNIQYKKAFPELAAEVRITALIILGKALICAICMPITQGDEAALPVPPSSLSSLYGTMTPIASDPRT